MNMAETPDLALVADIAEEYGASVRSILAAISRGRVPGVVRMGSALRIRRSQFRKHVVSVTVIIHVPPSISHKRGAEKASSDAIS